MSHVVKGVHESRSFFVLQTTERNTHSARHIQSQCSGPTQHISKKKKTHALPLRIVHMLLMWSCVSTLFPTMKGETIAAI
jgi:hypothetical protein